MKCSIAKALLFVSVPLLPAAHRACAEVSPPAVQTAENTPAPKRGAKSHHAPSPDGRPLDESSQLDSVSGAPGLNGSIPGANDGPGDAQPSPKKAENP